MTFTANTGFSEPNDRERFFAVTFRSEENPEENHGCTAVFLMSDLMKLAANEIHIDDMKAWRGDNFEWDIAGKLSLIFNDWKERLYAKLKEPFTRKA